MKAKAAAATAGTGTPKKSNLVVAPKPAAMDDIGSAIGALASAVSGISDELRPFYHIEPLADNVAHLSDVAAALGNLANATAMSIIAKNGTDEDRAIAVAYLKGWFEEFKE